MVQPEAAQPVNEAAWAGIAGEIEQHRFPGAVAAISRAGNGPGGAEWASEIRAFGTLSVKSDAGPVTEETPFRIASLSKLVAGALACKMLDQAAFSLDSAVTEWLPELADQRVMVDPAGSPTATEGAVGPIRVWHLLTNTTGAGVSFSQQETPLWKATVAAGLGPGVLPPKLSHAEYLRRFAALPLAHQPGEGWLYNTSAELLSILFERVAGQPLHDVLAEQVYRPLGMEHTAFFAASGLPALYMPGSTGLQEIDAVDGVYSRPPAFESLAAGLVTTAGDYLNFLIALAGDSFLDPELKNQMTTGELTPEIQAASELGELQTWGWQTGVYTADDENGIRAGSYGWAGGSGCSAAVDPGRGVIGLVFTQRCMAGPYDTFGYFWDGVE